VRLELRRRQLVRELVQQQLARCAAIVSVAACGANAKPASPTVPAPTHVDAAAACARLDPTPSGPVLGRLPRSAPPLAGTSVDGGAIDLAALRGHVVVIAFQASWNGLTDKERPTLAALATAVGAEVSIVRVMSDHTLADARDGIEPGAKYITMLDLPPAACANIGVVTHAWGVDLLPESFLVDRAGNARFHFVNWRDWSSPDAVACVRALASDAMPALEPMPLDTPKPTPDCSDAHGSPDHLIRGTISFGARNGLVPGTAILVIAKQADAHGEPTGPPLAVVKLTYGGADVPFVLDDSKAMIAETALTGDVVVTARYDQDGDPITKQPGDLTGRIRVTVPATDVKLVVDTIVR
jgi:thiol-disulfide isomerase/thioredoxin